MASAQRTAAVPGGADLSDTLGTGLGSPWRQPAALHGLHRPDLLEDRGGRYARNAFDARWHRLIDECLRIRASLPGRSAYSTPLARRRDTLNFIDMVISDVCRLNSDKIE